MDLIPIDVLRIILLDLNIGDIKNLSLCCKALYKEIRNDNLLWKYKYSALPGKLIVFWVDFFMF